jgi:pyridoxine 4-dehydrogenase
MGPGGGSIAKPFSVLAALQQEGKISHLGVSNVTATQLAEAQGISPVVCVQNNFNISNRGDRDLVDLCAGQGIAYVPFFPLGGFSPIHDDVLSSVAQRLGAHPTQLALAWLLHRSPTLLAVPGTKSRGHLESTMAAGALVLDDEAMRALDDVATAPKG